MAAPAAPDPTKVTIDGKTYDLAIERGGKIAHTVQSRGQDLRWERDYRSGSSGMGETVERSDTGYFFTDNIDRTKRGIRLSPTVTTVSTSAKLVLAKGQWFEDQDTGSTRYVYFSAPSAVDTVTIHKIRVSDDSMRNQRDFTFGGATAIASSQPARWNGSWFHAIDVNGAAAGINAIMQLTLVDTGTSNDTWATHSASLSGVRCLLVIDSIEGATPTLARITSPSNLIDTVSSTTASSALTEANWANAGIIGDTTGQANVATSQAGIHFIGKGDNLFAWSKGASTTDPGFSYGIIPFQNRFIAAPGAADTGYGLVPYGNRVFYSHFLFGLWGVTGVSDAKREGVDDIPYYTSAPNITTPVRLRYLEGVGHPGWLYFIYSPAVTSSAYGYLLAAQVKRSPVSGLSLTWHTLLRRENQMRCPYIDSGMRLWWAEPGQSRLAYIQLALDGSPDGATRGNTSSTYEDYESETDFGLPEVTKQFRYLFVEVEGGTANCSWQAKYYLDGGTVNSLGSAITTASTNLNWTVGTNDTGRRLRLRFTATTNGSHSTSTDPKIIRVVCYARSPDWVTAIVMPTAQRNLFETTKILRKLKDAGPFTTREPDTNENHTCYIKEVNTIRYQTDTGYADGVQIQYERFAAAA